MILVIIYFLYFFLSYQADNAKSRQSSQTHNHVNACHQHRSRKEDNGSYILIRVITSRKYVKAWKEVMTQDNREQDLLQDKNKASVKQRNNEATVTLATDWDQ